MDIPVFIPIRGISLSKQQLRANLDDKRVSSIVSYLLEQTIKCVHEAGLHPYILTADEDLAEQLTERHINIIRDDAVSLNHAIKNAMNLIKSEKYMIIMADLPNLSPLSIKKVLSIIEKHPNVVVPLYDGGTAIAVLPRSLLEMDVFNGQSANRIMEVSDELEIPIAQINIMDLSMDLDTLKDWEYWCQRIDLIDC